MNHELRDGFIEELKEYARKLQAFNVRISSNLMWEIDHEEARGIMDNIISPLFNNAENAILYNDGDNEYYSSILANIAKKRRNMYGLIVSQELFTDELLGFWSSQVEKRGSILWENDLSNIDMQKFLKSAKDPFVLGNMGAVLPKSAIRNARNLTKENAQKVVFCLSTSNGLEAVTIFMAPRVISDYVKAAIDNCTLSEPFLLRYGKGN